MRDNDLSDELRVIILDHLTEIENKNKALKKFCDNN